MAIYATEITSETDPSDSPLHQRLLKAYVIARDLVGGNVLEVGCGEGRGIGLMLDKSASFTAIDKIGEAISKLRAAYPSAIFIDAFIPPFKSIEDNSIDTLVSFQVIEHIDDDLGFLKEIHRVLRPGGKAMLTTPNRTYTLSRNPWHVREYTGSELLALAGKVFSNCRMQGIGGNEKVMTYYEQNKKSVRRITRFDVLDLQHRLPAALLKIPYEILNRLNRKKLQSGDGNLVSSIRHEDYLFQDDYENALDLFLTVTK
jgi:SAM-dependent methyltransferase